MTGEGIAILMIEKDIINVVAYRRVSTNTQLIKGQGLDEQKTSIERFCCENRMRIVAWFEDKGVSGTDESREGIFEALEYMKHNAVPTIVVRDIGRLWRDIYNQAYVMKSLEDMNADFISVEEKGINLQSLKNDPTQYLVTTIIQGIANYQRMEIKRKLAHGRYIKAEKGMKACGVAPYGYQWRDAKIVLVNEQSNVVKEIYNMYLKDGMSLQNIADCLNDKKIFNAKGNAWNKQSIKTVLTNDFYCGIIRHGTIKKVGTHESIVNKRLFVKVQRKLFENRRNRMNEL